jgi:hypothetical protein
VEGTPGDLVRALQLPDIERALLDRALLPDEPVRAVVD